MLFIMLAAVLIQTDGEIRIENTNDGNPIPIDCGNAFYGCEYSTAEIVGSDILDPLPPGTNPDHMYGVRFDPADFGWAPGTVYITQICVHDVIDCHGLGGRCAPRRRFFVYPDLNGLPDDSVVLKDFYFEEQGQGQVEFDFGYEAIPVDGPFWVMERGDPTTPGGWLGIETCFPFGAVGTGNSYASFDGIGFLVPTPFEDYLIRVELDAERPALPVPALSLPYLTVLTLMFGVFGLVIIVRLRRVAGGV